MGWDGKRWWRSDSQSSHYCNLLGVVWCYGQLPGPSDWPRIQWQSELQQSRRSGSRVNTLFFTDGRDLHTQISADRQRGFAVSICPYVFRSSVWLYPFQYFVLSLNQCDLDRTCPATMLHVASGASEAFEAAPCLSPFWDTTCPAKSHASRRIHYDWSLVGLPASYSGSYECCGGGESGRDEDARSFEAFSTIQSIPKGEWVRLCCLRPVCLCLQWRTPCHRPTSSP